MAYIAGISIRDGIHTDFSTGISGWNTQRTALTGEFTTQAGNVSGRYGEFSKDIQEYNRKIDTLSGAWNDTGMFLTPYNAGFRYTGTGDFNKWDTYSVDFDGVDEYVANGSDAGMPSGTDARTISLWIKHDGVSNDWGIFFNYGGEVASPTTLVTATSFALGWHGALAKMIVGSYARNASGGSSTTITSGAWHHVAVTYTGGNIVYYLDGVADGTATITIDTAVGDNDEFTIANTVRKYSDYLYDGLIDEVAIFDSALSAAQVTAIYNGGTPESLAPYSPVSWWRMGDGPLDNGNVAGNGLIGDQVNPTLGSELVTNGTMEVDANWADLNTPTTNERSTEQVYAGTYSRKFVTDSNGDGIKSDTFTVTAGKVYKVTAHLYISAIAGVGNNIQMRLQNGNGADVGGVNQSNTSTGGWITETFYTRATLSGSSSYFKINQAGNGTATAYLDNVSVKEVNGNAGLMINMAPADIVADAP